MTTEAQAFTWMPYKVVGIHPEVSPTCFIGSASAVRINGVECLVVTRGRLDLDSVLQHLTENDYDIDQRYAVCVLHSDSVEVEIPEVPEQLPSALPAAEQLEAQEQAADLPKEVDGVPAYQGTPVVKYIDPTAELESTVDKVTDNEPDQNAPAGAAEDDDEEL